ncbi:hypothetical protein HUG10_12930 [Halorarum halophilum]|uniref:Uncharacterized protein n=1 Tax=Halorarum halophilum TaxID=2743090 RepID=A0A7D5KMJ5_9EURY|nr:hypothetical protein [Halobaculum halophilum]QLG28395.1 hypothetical protein HUG10_12930 [Halobaculum halophilum]
MDSERRFATSPPLGIKIVCLLVLFSTIVGTAVVVSVADALDWAPRDWLVLTVTVVVSLFAVYGLWTLRPWGWTLAMASFAFNFVVAFAAFSGILTVGTEGAFSLVPTVIYAIYVYSKRDLYRPTPAEQ